MSGPHMSGVNRIGFEGEAVDLFGREGALDLQPAVIFKMLAFFVGQAVLQTRWIHFWLLL